MANNKKQDSERYSTAGLSDRSSVENAINNAYYQPGSAVADAAAALKQVRSSRPAEYSSAYQQSINSVLDSLVNRDSFQYSYAQDPLYKQYAQTYAQNAHYASEDAAAQAAALTGGYGSSYAVSAAQQAYQQQMNSLNSIIPTLYSLALDTYSSEGDALASKLDSLSEQEQNAQALYNSRLEDYYTQLEQAGDAYNTAYEQDYSQYLDYLSRLDSMRSYYAEQEQTQAAQRQQTFSNIITVLGVIGDAAQLALSGTTGLGSLAGSLLNTGYNIYADNRQYEADRADTAWSQYMQSLQRDDSIAQQQYKNETAEREYKDALAQQEYENSVTAQKLSMAKSEWALKQANAEKAASRASAAASSKAASGSAAAAESTSGSSASSGASGITVPYSAARLKSLGRTDSEIRSALSANGYTSAQIREIMQQMNG